MPEPPTPRGPRPPRLRWAWWLLAYASLGVGIVGIFVPGLPTTVFVLIRLAPGDPAYAMAGPLASSDDIERIRTSMGLDQSVFVQYLRYLQGLLHLDLGTSYSFQAPALDVVLDRMPYTLTLSIASITRS